MLSDSALGILSKVMGLSCDLRLTPFHWDPLKFKLTVISTHRELGTFYVTSLYLFVNTFYVVSDYIWRLTNSMFTVDLTFMSHTMFATVCIFGYIFSTNMYLRRHLVAELVTDIKPTADSIQDLFGQLEIGSEKRNKGSGFEIILKLTYIMLFIQPVSGFILFLEHPTDSRYLTSVLIRNMGSYSVPVQIGVAAFASLCVISYYAQCCAIMGHISLIGITMGYLVLQSLHNIQFLLAEYELVEDEEEKTKCLSITLCVYQILQIFLQIGNCFYSEYLVPGGMIFLLVTLITCNYVCIKAYHQIPMPVFAAFPFCSIISLTFLLIMLTIAGNVHSKSTRVIASLRKASLNIYVQHIGGKPVVDQLQACLPLKARFHIFFFYQRTTIITVVSILIIYTVKAILIF